MCCDVLQCKLAWPLLLQFMASYAIGACVHMILIKAVPLRASVLQLLTSSHAVPALVTLNVCRRDFIGSYRAFGHTGMSGCMTCNQYVLVPTCLFLSLP